MECEQTLDVVDTPPPFRPSLEDFQESEEVIKWHDIQTGTYKVFDLHRGRNKYGPSVVLKLENAKGATFSVWAPSSLFYAIEKRKSTKFFLNLGAQRSEEMGNIFYDFKLC